VIRVFPRPGADYVAPGKKAYGLQRQSDKLNNEDAEEAFNLNISAHPVAFCNIAGSDRCVSSLKTHPKYL
jgi:hypothetical protein